MSAGSKDGSSAANLASMTAVEMVDEKVEKMVYAKVGTWAEMTVVVKAGKKVA